MILAAGAKNTPITIQYKLRSQTGSGAITYQWRDIAVSPKMWAEKFDRSGVQGFVADQDLSRVTARFRIDYREDVTADMRVVCKGRFYNIHYALDITGTNEYLELMCEIGANDG